MAITLLLADSFVLAQDDIIVDDMLLRDDPYNEGIKEYDVDGENVTESSFRTIISPERRKSLTEDQIHFLMNLETENAEDMPEPESFTPDDFLDDVQDPLPDEDLHAYNPPDKVIFRTCTGDALNEFPGAMDFYHTRRIYYPNILETQEYEGKPKFEFYQKGKLIEEKYIHDKNAHKIHCALLYRGVDPQVMHMFNEKGFKPEYSYLQPGVRIIDEMLEKNEEVPMFEKDDIETEPESTYQDMKAVIAQEIEDGVNIDISQFENETVY